MPSIVEKLTETTDLRQFSRLAERALSSLSSPRTLARCAMIVSAREPGGGYYRARFWSQVSESTQQRANGDYAIKVADILRDCGISRTDFNRYILQGKIISEVEANHREEESLRLRALPRAIFNLAAKQRARGGEYLDFALGLSLRGDELSAVQINNEWCKINGNRRDNLDIIKPSDWWAFGQPKWKSEMRGAIPGEIYANALYYYAPLNGVAVDSMAGGGTLKMVYDERDKWRSELNFRLKIQMFDLYPASNGVNPHDARHPLPIKADWIFIDPPYFRQGANFYNGLLAQTCDYGVYFSYMEKIIAATYASLNMGGRFCLFCPKHRGDSLCKFSGIDVPSDLKNAALSAGFHWLNCIYVSRGRQQLGDAMMRNAQAKRFRHPISDVCVLNVFEKAVI